MSQKLNTIQTYDAIIIGSGCAGLNASLNLAKKGRVLVLTKSSIRDSNTWHAQGGIAAAISNTDSINKHIEDTLIAGHFLNKKSAVKMIIKSAPQAIKELRKIGVKFTITSSDLLSLHREGGHSESRIIHFQDQTGMAIEKALIEKVKNNSKITIKEKVFVKDLLTQNNECYGVTTIEKGRKKKYFSKITVIASGGIGQIYKRTTNPEVATGDGIAMAIRSKVQTKNLNYVQFHPTALDINASPLPLLTEALRGAGAYIINSKQNRFILKRHKLAELAPRDVVSKLIVQEQKKGQIYLDMRHIKKKTLTKEFPGIIKILNKHKLNPNKDIIPITPAAHYLCGGIETDLKAKTSMKRLYAVGEVAYTGLHGSNRLASNSLLEAIVMSDQLKKVQLKEIPESIMKLNNRSEEKTTIRTTNDKELIIKIKDIMWKAANVNQTKSSLKNGLESLLNISKKHPRPGLQALNMLTVAIAVIEESLQMQTT